MKCYYSALLLVLYLLAGCTSGDSPAPAVLTKTGAGSDEIPVIVVSGTPYEMGLQIGNKLGAQIDSCVNGYLEFAYNQPQIFNAATLDSAWNKLVPFIDNRLIEEMRGIAESSGVPLQKLQRAHAVPALADYACSGIAVWGKASQDGHLYHLRNLDFIKAAHLQDYPVIVVYKPKNGIAHTIATFAGYIGAHSGMNAQGIVLGEKGESPHRDAPFNIDGIHFSFLFRQILYDATNLQDAISAIEQAPLIKRYFFFVSDGKPESMGAVKFQVATPDPIKLRRFSDDDATDDTVPGVLPDCIYYTMDNAVAYDRLKKNSGSFNAASMIDLSRVLAQKNGNLLNIVYDATTLRMWVAFAEKNEDAASRNYVEFSLLKFLTSPN